MQVDKSQAEGFAKVWVHPSGLAFKMDEISIRFATDFANVVLKSFIAMCEQAKAQQKSAAKPAPAPAPAVTLEAV